jgi:hypothetical protein
MRPKSGIEAPDEDPDRAPKPGVAGSNPAGGTQNPEPLTRRHYASQSICPINDADFIARFIARRTVARILLVCMVARDAPAVMEHRRMRQDATAVGRGDGALLLGPCLFPDTLEPSDIERAGPLAGARGLIDRLLRPSAVGRAGPGPAV